MRMMRILFSTLIGAIVMAVALFSIAPVAEAHTLGDPLVTCRTVQACTFCEFFHTVQHVINFLIFGLALPLAGLFFLVGAFLIMVSGITAFTEWTGKGGAELHSLGVRAITGVVIGLLIVFLAWVFINELLLIIVEPTMFPRPWNEIQCQ